jgi:toxin ParE1/3/4
MKPVVRRAKVDDDIRQAIGYYQENAPEYTERLIDAIEETFRHISQNPGIGSPRYAHELDLPGLRFWICNRFPYLVFYVERSDVIDVWRLLHGSRDIPKSLQQENSAVLRTNG